MKYEAYISKLKEKFERHFEIETDSEILGRKIDMHARFSSINGRTFITKNDVIDKYETHEFCYIKRYDNVTSADISEFGEFLRSAVDEYVNPGTDHMSTYITGVIVTDNISDDVIKEVERFKHSKTYMFYLRGWCDVRLVCVDLSKKNIVTNKAARRIEKVYKTAL